MASLDANMTEAQMARAAFQGNTLSWFYEKVRNANNREQQVAENRSWDYKQLDRNFGDFTNFNYGATGQKAGISRFTLSLASMFAHYRAHGFDALRPAQLLNEGHDQLVLWRGFNYAAKGCR